jgi:hypothetical protein
MTSSTALLVSILRYLLCMQEFCVAVLPSAERSLQAKGAKPGQGKGKKKTTKAQAKKAPELQGNMAQDEEEEWDMEESRRKVQTALHLPITDAAKVLGVGVTKLKKRCRKINIARCPFRKLLSIEKLIESVAKVPSL